METSAQHFHPGDDSTPWSGSFAGLILVTILLVAYVLTANRQKRRGYPSWSAWRVAAFTGGITLLAIALLPPLMTWAHESLQGHMVQHLLMGMFAPLGLVLGAPGTLLLRSVPVQIARRIMAFLATWPIRIVVHPVTALVLDIGGMYLLYLTSLYALSLADPKVHTLVHGHFVISGYLFTWAIAGPDPAPHRPGKRTRLAVLFVATTAHAILGKLMFGYGFPRGTDYGSGEIEAAAQLMYYGGDIAEMLLAAAFFAIFLPLPYSRQSVPRTY